MLITIGLLGLAGLAAAHAAQPRPRRVVHNACRTALAGDMPTTAKCVDNGRALLRKNLCRHGRDSRTRRCHKQQVPRTARKLALARPIA